MLEAFSTPQARRRTIPLLVLCAGLAVAAGVVGVDDNLPGIALGCLSATALVLAFVHPWRTPRPFRRLIYASLLGFVAFAFLSDALESATSKAGIPSAVDALLNATAVAAMLLCPVAFVAGVIGVVVTSIRRRLSPPDRPAA